MAGPSQVKLGLLVRGSLSPQDIKQLLNPLALGNPSKLEAGLWREREVFGGGAGPKQVPGMGLTRAQADI